MQTLVRLDGVVADTLDTLVHKGVFKTRSEAIRAGILELGKEYGAIRPLHQTENQLVVRKIRQIDAEIRSGKRRLLSEKDALAKYRR